MYVSDHAARLASATLRRARNSAWATVVAAAALLGLALATTGYARAPLSVLERGLALVGGMLLLSYDPIVDVAGFAALATALGLHLARGRKAVSATP